MRKKIILMIIFIFILISCNKNKQNKFENEKKEIKPIAKNLADPFILNYKNKFYLYGTNENIYENNLGFKVYQSNDLKNWNKNLNKYVLSVNDSWGNRWFWAPEVYYLKNKFYMYYTVNEHLAVAVSNSPLGPFKQKIKKPMHKNTKEIDPTIFVDDDKTVYIYFVRFDHGNVIYMAKLNDDLLSMDDSSVKKILEVSQNWEKSKDYPVNIQEAPTVIKINNLYIMTYSANSFKSINYGVGIATAKSLSGPWIKYKNNPILYKRNKNLGTGHNGLVKKGKQYYIVYHSHNSKFLVSPRKVFVEKINFKIKNNKLINVRIGE